MKYSRREISAPARIRTGPATRGSVQVVVLLTRNAPLRYEAMMRSDAYYDRYSTRDRRVDFEPPNYPADEDVEPPVLRLSEHNGNVTHW